MFLIGMSNLVSTMIAAGGVSALPVRTNWPVHRAVAWLADEARRSGLGLLSSVSVCPDPDACVALGGVDEAIEALVEEGFLSQSGTGYLARWVVDPASETSACRRLMREDVATARLVAQAGQRLATWASTALKNADRAAASWSSTVSSGTPTVRHPPLLALR